MSAVRVRNKEARDLLVKAIGLVVHRLDTGTYEVYDGNPESGWTEVKEPKA